MARRGFLPQSTFYPGNCGQADDTKKFGQSFGRMVAALVSEQGRFPSATAYGRSWVQFLRW
jgi:hypothetical protein